jgi:GntR family transcriptional regulator
MLRHRALYHQIRDFLATQIAGGAWKPGASLPNESDLARELGVSPGTARKALEMLEAGGFVVRRQGRGTFVLDQASREVAGRFDKLRGSDGERLVPDVKVVEQGLHHPTEEEQAHLKVRPEEKILRTRRLQTLRGRPFLYEVAAVAASRLPGLQLGPVQDHPIAILAQRHGMHLAQGSEKLSVTAATCEAAASLCVEPGRTLLKLDRVLFSADGNPVEWRLAMCNADTISYRATLR